MSIDYNIHVFEFMTIVTKTKIKLAYVKVHI